jgi:hypothetical protein
VSAERCPSCGEPFTADAPAASTRLHDGSELQTHAGCDPLAHAEVVQVPADFRPEHHPEVIERVKRGHRIGHVQTVAGDPTYSAVYLIPPLH